MDQREHNIRLAAEKAGVDSQEELALFIRSFQEDDFSIQETLTQKKWKQVRIEIGKPKSKKSMLFFRNEIDSSIIKNKAPVLKAIIMGPCGHGKTSLVNNLCGSDL